MKIYQRLSSAFNRPYTPTVPGANLDPYWDKVVLLLKAEGADASVPVDSSPYARVVTGAGVTTSDFKFGTGSLVGNGVVSVAMANPSELAFGTSTDFTVECWVKPDVLTNTTIRRVLAIGSGTSYTMSIQRDASLAYRMSFAGLSMPYGAITPGVWQHVAWSREGNTRRAFVNGSQVEAIVGSLDYLPTGSDVMIGASVGGTTGSRFNGLVDELRITKGLARYVGGFTPAESLPIPVHTNVTLTSGTSYTVPENVAIWAEAWGGGQGGTGAGSYGNGGRGGDGGSYVRSRMTGVAAGAMAYAIGAGGVGKNAGDNSNAGGDTWFGATSTLLAKGGKSSSTNVGDEIYAGGVVNFVEVGGIQYSNGFNGGGGGAGSGGGSWGGVSGAGAAPVNNSYVTKGLPGNAVADTSDGGEGGMGGYFNGSSYVSPQVGDAPGGGGAGHAPQQDPGSTGGQGKIRLRIFTVPA